MKVNQTTIPGVLLIELDLFPDERGSFREAWQNEKMRALGLPEIKPVQFNVSHNKKGSTRGVHAEPWDKYIHLTYGRAFAAMVDLRPDSETFGKVEEFELDETKAIFVPSGVGNSFQALTEPTVYGYLVTDHWRPGITYPAVALDDLDLKIAWPIPREEWIVSEKDLKNPPFSAIVRP